MYGGIGSAPHYNRAQHAAMDFAIRKEVPADVSAIRGVVDAAFGTPGEAKLVDSMRERGDTLLSLVAVSTKADSDTDGASQAVIGHIAFSRCTVGGTAGALLAPLGVLPSAQRSGVGSALVKQGLEELRSRGEPFVLVLGHPKYYPKFGFDSALTSQIKAPWPSGDAFMGIHLTATAASARGNVPTERSIEAPICGAGAGGAGAGGATGEHAAGKKLLRGELKIAIAFDEMQDCDEH